MCACDSVVKYTTDKLKVTLGPKLNSQTSFNMNLYYESDRDLTRFVDGIRGWQYEGATSLFLLSFYAFNSKISYWTYVIEVCEHSCSICALFKSLSVTIKQCLICFTNEGAGAYILYKFYAFNMSGSVKSFAFPTIWLAKLAYLLWRSFFTGRSTENIIIRTDMN